MSGIHLALLQHRALSVTWLRLSMPPADYSSQPPGEQTEAQRRGTLPLGGKGTVRSGACRQLNQRRALCSLGLVGSSCHCSSHSAPLSPSVGWPRLPWGGLLCRWEMLHIGGLCHCRWWQDHSLEPFCFSYHVFSRVTGGSGGPQNSYWPQCH